MNLRQTIITFLFLSIIHSISASDVVDGKWNAKPWDKNKLEEDVKKDDPHALAEWAYCSIGTFGEIHFDEELIYQRSERSAMGGSLLGKYLLGVCYVRGLTVARNPKKGINLIREAGEAGHPEARWQYHVYLRNGYNVKKDMTNALQRMQQALKDGAWRAHWSLAGIYAEGKIGVVDLEKAAHHYHQAIVVHKDSVSANEIHRKIVSRKAKALIGQLSREVIMQATPRVQKAGRLGDPFCKYLGALYNIDRGNPHEGIPALIELANLPDDQMPVKPLKSILNHLGGYMNRGIYSRIEGCDVAIGDVSSRRRAAKACYKSGIRTERLERLFADAVLFPPKGEQSSVKDKQMAIELLRKYIRQRENKCHAHHILAKYFRLQHLFHGAPREVFERGMAHDIYHAECASAAHWICASYLTNKKTYDIVKGVAAAEWAIKKNERAWKKSEQMWLKKARKKLTPEQAKEAQILIEEGFPYAKKFRVKAFNYLKEVGDIPADREFEKAPKPDNEADDFEEVSLPKELQKNLVTAYMIAAKSEIVEKSSFSIAERQLMIKYLEGKDLNDDELRNIVVLVTKDDEKLNALLSDLSDGKYAGKVNELMKVIGNEHQVVRGHTILGATVGWYLIYKEGKVSSRPYICKREPKGAAEKSSLHIGDLIMKCNGVDMKGGHSRNLFIRLLAFWPKNETMKLNILRNRYHKEADDVSVKDVKKTIILKFRD